MFKSSALILLIFTALSGAAASSDQELGTLLAARYSGQVLALRHSFREHGQDYDFEGNALNAGKEGSWTVYGRIQVRKVSVAPDRLQLEGDRVAFESVGPGKPLEAIGQREHVRIAIRLNHALASEDEAVAVLGRVFALTPQVLVNSAPPLWRTYLAKQLGVPAAPNPDAVRDGVRDKDGEAGAEIGSDGAGHETVFKLGESKAIVAPKPRSTPEPEYSDAARELRLQGTLGLSCVIDSTGRVRDIAVAHPLGLGLDEQAADTVRTWKFKPGMRDGQPVAVALYIEVDFRLGN
jgi:TonB family protein